MARKKAQSTKLKFAPESRLQQKRGERFRKFGGVVALMVFLVAVLVGLCLLGWGGREVFFARNPHFTLHQVIASSDGRLTPQELAGALEDLGVVPGEVNLFDLDLRKIRNTLKAKHVLVKEARFSRIMPNTLEVKVVEPQPVARFRNDMLVDREGLVLPERTDSMARALPLLAGFRESNDATPGDQLADPMVAAGLRFLSLTKTDSCGEYVEPSLIQPDYSAKALKIYLVARGPFRDKAQLVIPSDPERMAAAMAKVDTIVRERYRANQAIGFMDATFEKNIPVRP